MARFLPTTIRQQLTEAPELLDWFDQQLAGCGEPLLQQLVEAVDDSAFSLRQWIQALAMLQGWLAARGLQAAMPDQIGYIGCACAAAGALSGYQSLTLLVEDFLGEYGFDRAVPIRESDG